MTDRFGNADEIHHCAECDTNVTTRSRFELCRGAPRSTLSAQRTADRPDPVCAEVLLDEAHAALIAEADRIRDVGLRQLFLSRINEHREIVELWTQRQRRLISPLPLMPP